MVTGASTVTVPATTKVLFVTVTAGTSTTIAWPLVAAYAAGGALVAGTAEGVSAYQRVNRVEREWQEIVES